MERTAGEGSVVVRANCEFSMNGDSCHAEDPVLKDVHCVNCADAKDHEEKGEVVGAAKLVANRGKKQGSAGKKVKRD